MGKFYCRVAPYALADALIALENSADKNRRIDYVITKEDGDLFLMGREVFLSGGGSVTTCGRPPLTDNSSIVSGESR